MAERVPSCSLAANRIQRTGTGPRMMGPASLRSTSTAMCLPNFRLATCAPVTHALCCGAAQVELLQWSERRQRKVLNVAVHSPITGEMIRAATYAVENGYAGSLSRRGSSAVNVGATSAEAEQEPQLSADQLRPAQRGA
jgi:hypothetical protein